MVKQISVVGIFVIGLLILGCEPIKRQPISVPAGKTIKLIGLLKVENPPRYQSEDNDPALQAMSGATGAANAGGTVQTYGAGSAGKILIGSLDSTIKQNHQMEFDAVLDSHQFNPAKSLNEALKAELTRAGFEVVEIETPRLDPAKKKLWPDYRAVPTNAKVDAILDVSLFRVGFVRHNQLVGCRYAPHFEVLAGLGDPAAGACYYAEHFIFCSEKHEKCKWLAPQRTEHYASFDAMMARPGKVYEELQSAAALLAKAIVTDLNPKP